MCAGRVSKGKWRPPSPHFPPRTPHLWQGGQRESPLGAHPLPWYPPLTLARARPLYVQTSRDMPLSVSNGTLENYGPSAETVLGRLKTRRHGPFLLCLQAFSRLTSARGPHTRPPRSPELTRCTDLQKAGQSSRSTSHRPTSSQRPVARPAPFSRLHATLAYAPAPQISFATARRGARSLRRSRFRRKYLELSQCQRSGSANEIGLCGA